MHIPHYTKDDMGLRMKKPAKRSWSSFASFSFLLAVLIQASLWRHANRSLASVDKKLADHPSTKPNERMFLRYISSEWEQMWLDNVDDWTAKKRICEELLSENQARYLYDFLNLTCTTRVPRHPSWCVMDDAVSGLRWHKLGTAKVTDNQPPEIPDDIELPEPQPVIPTREHEHIVSRFVYLNESSGEEYVEYIEPLVSHLRHPLTQCTANKRHLNTIRNYIIPPPPPSRQQDQRKSLYFDAGASNWIKGAGGPSLSYFAAVWNRHGIVLDRIHAYEGSTTPLEFYETVPEDWQKKTFFQQAWVASYVKNHTFETPFLPLVIEEQASKDDYVLFKLDIDSPGVECGIVDYLVSENNSDALEYIDEFFWEHHIVSNYLMAPAWFRRKGIPEGLKDVPMRESYEYFLKMRKKGVRAHSWV